MTIWSKFEIWFKFEISTFQDVRFRHIVGLVPVMDLASINAIYILYTKTQTLCLVIRMLLLTILFYLQGFETSTSAQFNVVTY